MSSFSITNLERLLQCLTPDVPSKIIPKSCLNDVNRQWLPLSKDEDKFECFTLKDLWGCYDEWSIFGAGTPVVLENGDTVNQFYIPFLSAIQIYSYKPVGAPSPRNRSERNNGAEFDSDSSSDETHDGKSRLSRSSSGSSNKAWDASSFGSISDQVGLLANGEKLGYLNFQYTETAPPHLRVPLSEKIAELAKIHPALMTLKSVNLSPASWMAVAWYPIYAIPSYPNDTCFLTYHSLSSSYEDCANKYFEVDLRKDIFCPTGWGSIVGEKLERKKSACISLSPFGLATYRFQGDVWINLSNDNDDSDDDDNGKLSDLFGAADSWLKQIDAEHHDFKFFRDVK
ncbi:hypothetical protein RIF29_21726 [Crotalaria pallida]|uniref:Uncharacterized protein n=1 Tax=Crotalaria pallida TaxID=3830 RepID=A0AAN9F789_CROPI